MVQSIVFSAAFALLAASAMAEIDFTPQESFYLAENTKVPCIAFHNGHKEMSYAAPHGWTVSGGGRKVSLIPPDKVQASATMETNPTKEPLPATEANLKAYGELALRQLPREATKVTVVQEAAICSMRIARREMVEITLSYVLFGQQFTTNIVYLPYDKEEITFQIAARNADFAPLAKAFRASLFSLQGL